MAKHEVNQIFFLHFYGPLRQSRSIKMKKKNEASIQPS